MFARSPGGDGGKPPGEDAISRSVELGYRVVDDYLRLGQQIAGRVAEPGGATGGIRDFQDLAARMARYVSDLTELWFQLTELGTRVNVSPARGPKGAPTNGAESAASPAVHERERDDDVRIAIEIESRRPLSITLDLRESAFSRPVVVHSLRADDPDKPRLTGLRLQAATPVEPPRVALRVPDDQPTGTYNGMVVDEATSRPLGTVSVRIGEGSGVD